MLGDACEALIGALYRDGGLEVVIPMAEQHKARKVAIGATEGADRAIAVDSEAA